MNDPVVRIRARRPQEKITTQLVAIQTAQVEQQKSLDFIKNLRCLYFTDSPRHRNTNRRRARSTRSTLRLRTINAFKEPRYVALSYTWRRPPEELGVPEGGYMVESPSSVRDTVFVRMKKYMEYVGAEYLWIDKHCIDQEEGEAKEIGMQAMDRVYSLSKYPVALLARPVKTPHQLQLLIEILSGDLVVRWEKRYWLSSSTSWQRALQALRLLNYLTSDMWFSRGWTYQENYRAKTKMTLLVPHSPNLNDKKPHGLLGSLDGELCINSVNFHEQATMLCLAYQSHQPPPPYLGNILSRAGKYTILLQSGDLGCDDSAPVSMTPQIIEDVTGRELDRDWDRLAIIANCCQYINRLDSRELQQSGYSLSLSLLTLCLVNGEILSNHPAEGVNAGAARAAPFTDILHMHFFDGLECPEPTGKLTFNKGCRFSSVILAEEGVKTEGHLWRLDEEIPTNGFHRHVWHKRTKRNRPGRQRRALRPLRWLAFQAANRRLRILSERLHSIVDLHHPATFAAEWQKRMATKIEEAIYRGKTLCTATLLGPGPRGVAIFIIESGEDGSERKLKSGYVFTSFQPERRDSEGFYYNDIDRHVSLEVDCFDLEMQYGQCPKLFTKRWIHGLCFFHGCSPRHVVFPWPASLRDL
ncbi:heterokaryon incompatibility protein-domain-containing protein [Fusarium solani]|uniref:Heterokaryon incompatibility protein-domain-containing protein n=1 Tax=Fusarium solani TaxID=169388 RepID=A0A9P9K4J4_FUSSL|nr:heterokaryon incompatibility protein-domain-containing protein [Fusarium solani]KAH7243971.1 heterokaryon incompatibility protein-domain-containing protein [Fusarium solani]